ncbi:MAG: NUDIX hydrolase [Gammaproteobacteria bacterium]|nr:NUDIX hydrolase [Gammaproteobacteria bacterium]
MASLPKQYGVLPYFQSSGKIKIILITSRLSNQWIVPKGNRVPNKSKRESALQEAYEEAGLTGQLDVNLKCCFNIMSHGEKVDLTLYPMRTDKRLSKKWPESHQRKRIEVSTKQAKSLVVWPEIVACINLLEKTV